MIVEVNSSVGRATQAGRFILAPTLSPRLPSQVIRRVRCRMPIHSSPAVMMAVAIEIPMIWSSAAPPPSVASTAKTDNVPAICTPDLVAVDVLTGR